MVSTRSAFSSFSVNDLDAARRFYSDVLGIEVVSFEEGLGLKLESGGRVFLYPKDNHVPATFTVLHIPVDDVTAVVDDLTAKGVTFERYEGFDQDERGIVRAFEGGPDMAWFTDPAGNVVGIAAGMDEMYARVAGS